MEILEYVPLWISFAVIGTLCNGITLFCVIKKYKFTVGMNRRGLLSITVSDTLFCLTSVIFINLYYSYSFEQVVYVAPSTLSVLTVVFMAINSAFLLASEWSKLSFIVVMVTSLKHPFEVLSNIQWKKRICVSLVLIWILSFILPSCIVVAGIYTPVIQGLPDDWKVLIFFFVLIFMIIMVLPGIVSLILLFFLCVFVYKANKKRFSSSQNEVPWVQRLNNIKFTLLKCLMISLISTCGTPLQLVIQLVALFNLNMMTFTLLVVTNILGYLTFIISPWIFALKARETLKKLFCCGRPNEAVSGHSGSTGITSV